MVKQIVHGQGKICDNWVQFGFKWVSEADIITTAPDVAYANLM